MYYMTDLGCNGVGEKRDRALFAPREEQKNDVDVLNLIEKRSK